jgi:hypothetical protein
MTEEIQTKVLTGMAVVNLEIHAWGGRTQLKASDFMNPNELPPETAVNFGSKKLIDHKWMSSFNGLRQRANKICFKRGVPFVGGYAISVDNIGVTMAELEKVQAEYYETANKLVATYDEEVERWITSNPGFEAQLRNSALPRSRVEKKFSFDFTVFQLQSVPESNLEIKTLGLMDEVLKDVENRAKDYIKRSMPDDHHSYTTSRARIPLLNIVSKLDQLRFVSSEIGTIIDWVQDVADRLPNRGGLTGANYREFVSMMHLLTDGNKIREAAAEFSRANQSGLIVSDSEEVVTNVATEEKQPVAPSQMTRVNTEPMDTADVMTQPLFDLGTNETKSEIPGKVQTEAETPPVITDKLPEEPDQSSTEVSQQIVEDNAETESGQDGDTVTDNPLSIAVGEDFMPSVTPRVKGSVTAMAAKLSVPQGVGKIQSLGF